MWSVQGSNFDAAAVLRCSCRVSNLLRQLLCYLPELSFNTDTKPLTSSTDRQEITLTGEQEEDLAF